MTNRVAHVTFVTRWTAAALALTCTAWSAGPSADDKRGMRSLQFANPAGVAETVHTSGRVDFANEFFQALGTNGRSCDSCHQARDGWSLTPASLQERFDATDGTDPVFRTNDGSNSPHADVSTLEARRGAFSMLLAKGVIRIGLPLPPDAEFELVRAEDPYGFAHAAELSLFRRPLPATNLPFTNTVMWDARETFVDAASTDCIVGTSACFAPHASNLGSQANGATVGHAQSAAPLTDAQRHSIVRFELGLLTTQIYDSKARRLAPIDDRHAGARALAAEPFYFGINDFAYGDYRLPQPFDSDVFRLFTAWTAPRVSRGDTAEVIDARRAIARGEALFNTRTFRISGVRGFNDAFGGDTVTSTCSACHNAPGVGSSSLPALMDIGVSDAARRTPDMPLYVLRHKATREVVGTTDPGRGLITGKWDDIGRFKVPGLRALAARAPYFHDGSAANLAAVIDFYDRRFQMQLTDAEKASLVAFLQAL